MSGAILIIGIVVALIVLFVIARIIRNCLPKIVIGVLILGALVYLAYWYFSR